jgi:hypothetical protein
MPTVLIRVTMVVISISSTHSGCLQCQAPIKPILNSAAFEAYFACR